MFEAGSLLGLVALIGTFVLAFAYRRHARELRTLRALLERRPAERPRRVSKRRFDSPGSLAIAAAITLVVAVIVVLVTAALSHAAG